ncbi:MAG: hypothetical protein ACRCS8_00215 [Brevinema sp.]
MSISELESLHTVPTLSQISKTWEAFIRFQAAFLQFPDSQLVLNFSSLNLEFLLDFSVEKLGLIKSEQANSKDLLALNTIWEMPFDSLSLKICLNIWDPQFQLSSEVLDEYDLFIKEIRSSDINPMIQLTAVLYKIWQMCQEHTRIERVLRVLQLHFSKEIGLVKLPFFYPDTYLVIPYVFKLSPNNLTEETVIKYLSQFERVCLLGAMVLELSSSKTANMMKTLDEKIENETALWRMLCSHIFVEISEVMEISGWKRDKSARFLNQLSNEGLFLAQKIGTQKYFINLKLAEIFKDLKQNQSIQQFLTPNIL